MVTIDNFFNVASKEIKLIATKQLEKSNIMLLLGDIYLIRGFKCYVTFYFKEKRADFDLKNYQRINPD